MLLDFFCKREIQSAYILELSLTFRTKEYTNLISHFLLIGLTSLVSLIASSHFE